MPSVPGGAIVVVTAFDLSLDGLWWPAIWFGYGNSRHNHALVATVVCYGRRLDPWSTSSRPRASGPGPARKRAVSQLRTSRRNALGERPHCSPALAAPSIFCY